LQSYTLYEVNEHIRRIIALNFSEALWIRAEIGQIGYSRGHYFITLIQKEEEREGILAEAEAVVWQMQYRQIKRQIGNDIDILLKEGTAILFKAKPEFHERFGFKLIIEAIDPAFTLGQLELQRRQILEALEAEQLLDLNQQHTLPIAIQRIAVLSSPKAAGYQDFIEQLLNNPYGYTFKPQLFPIAVQGEKVESEMLQQLKRIEQKSKQYDVVCLIRGGGSKLDLTAFDSFPLAKAVAQFSLPFLSGIGHDINQTVVDRVAHTALKTPTAVADFLINHNLHFELWLNQISLKIQHTYQEHAASKLIQLTELQQQLGWQIEKYINEQQRLIEFIEGEIPKISRYTLRAQKQKVEAFDQIYQLLSPEATLKRGYTLTLKDGEVITSSKDLKQGDQITTRMKDGDIESEVK
jgi:exodeoxyribonuclease VII large subunit